MLIFINIARYFHKLINLTVNTTGGPRGWQVEQSAGPQGWQVEQWAVQPALMLGWMA